MFNLSFNDSNFYKGQNNEDLLVMGAIGGEVILKSKPVKLNCWKWEDYCSVFGTFQNLLENLLSVIEKLTILPHKAEKKSMKIEGHRDT